MEKVLFFLRNNFGKPDGSFTIDQKSLNIFQIKMMDSEAG